MGGEVKTGTVCLDVNSVPPTQQRTGRSGRFAAEKPLSFINSHFSVPQVLLDWCTHALTGWYSRKVDFSHGVLEGLWHYLDDLLHNKKLHLLLKQGKTISLRLNMAQVQ